MTPREVHTHTMSELTEFQQAVLVGTLLGDGSIAKHGRHHRLFIKHKAAHVALAAWKREVFADFTSMPLHHFDQRLNDRLYPCVQFVTRTAPVFSLWRERFYRARPEDRPGKCRRTPRTSRGCSVVHGRWHGRSGRRLIPDTKLPSRRGRVSRDSTARSLWAEDKPEQEQGRLGRVRTRLEREGASGARGAVHAPRARIQAGPARTWTP